MSWVRLDDAFPSHRKIRRLSDAAFRMHVSALCWSSKYGTDGHITTEDLPLVADLDGHMDPQVFLSVTKELIQRGLWHDSEHTCDACPAAGDGWVVHDFLDFNPSSEQVEDQRRAATERQRRSRERRNGEKTDVNATGDGDVTRDRRASHGVSHGGVTAPRPVPLPQPLPHKKTCPSTTSTRSSDDIDFVKFWSTYPKKVAKAAAAKAWTKARKKTSADVITAGAERYRDTVRGADPQYVAGAAKWLNDERWADEPPPAGQRASPANNTWTPYLNDTDPHAYDGYGFHAKASDDDPA